MGSSQRLLLASLLTRVTALRPGLEAFLLAAIALGCAQLGWDAIRTNIAHGGANASSPASLVQAPVRSPFVPFEGPGEAASHSVATFLSGVRLLGVRMSTDPAASGAVLTLDDGQQRAFLIGQEIGRGVRLADVRADHVLLSHAGGHQQISLPQRALASPVTPAMASAASVETVAKQGATLASAADAAWLATVISARQPRDGPRGWRIPERLPPAAEAIGLRAGDVVLAVNGVGPNHAQQALNALKSGRIDLLVMRGRGERVQLTLELDTPA